MLGPNQDVLPPQSEAVTLFSLLQMIADPEKTKQQLTVWLETKQSVEKAQADLHQFEQVLIKKRDDLRTQQSNLDILQNKLSADQKTHDNNVAAVTAREEAVSANRKTLREQMEKLNALDDRLRDKENRLKQFETELTDRKQGLDNRTSELDAAEKAHADRVSKLKALIA